MGWLNGSVASHHIRNGSGAGPTSLPDWASHFSEAPSKTATCLRLGYSGWGSSSLIGLQAHGQGREALQSSATTNRVTSTVREGKRLQSELLMTIGNCRDCFPANFYYGQNGLHPSIGPSPCFQEAWEGADRVASGVCAVASS